MRRRKLFVHVGPMKTGTTAIQSCLREHDWPSLIYPKKYLFAGAHHTLVFNFFGDRRTKVSGVVDVADLLGEIRALANDNDRDVIISSEALVPMAWQPHVAEPGALIRAILPCVGEPAPDVEILIGCREHFSWAASTYSQTLKGNAKSDPDEFLCANYEALRFAPILSNLEQTGYRVTPLNYHPSESWVERFMTHVGIPPESLPQTRSRNISLNPAGLIMKLAANRALPGEQTSRKLRNTLKSMPEFGSTSKFIFGAEAAKTAERVFSEDRRMLSEKYGIEFLAPDLNSPNMFFVNEQDLEMIGAVARDMGIDDEALSAAARPFLRN